MDEYPKDTKEFDKWFPSDNECLNYIIRLRWPNGYQCPHCHVVGQSWLRDRGRIKCKNCRHEQSVTGGTIFHRSHTPLRTWFKIMWHICLQKNGYSAMSLQRSLGFSYPTAWLCLHKLRKAMGQNRKDLLSGEVEVMRLMLVVCTRENAGEDRWKGDCFGSCRERGLKRKF